VVVSCFATWGFETSYTVRLALTVIWCVC